MTTYALSASQAGALAQCARLLSRRGQLTAHQFRLLDAMLWQARRPGSGMLTASLKVLARLAGQGRSTVAAGIAILEKLGLIQRIRRRVKMAWIGGAIASRQIANAYVFKAPDTESRSRPAREQPSRILIMEALTPATRMAQDALASRRQQVERALLKNTGTKLLPVTAGERSLARIS